MNNIGKQIKIKRQLRGLTQEQLADAAKVNLRTIQRIENSESKARGNTLILICDVLDLDIEELLKANFKTEPEAKITSDKNVVFNYRLASKGTRLLATFLESLIFFFTFFVPVGLIGKMSLRTYLKFSSHPISWTLSIISAVIIGAVCYPYLKGNIGHNLLKLKVISSETGEDYTKSSQGAFREFLKAIFIFFIVPAIWILWDRKNQNLYDKFTKTYVVENS